MLNLMDFLAVAGMFVLRIGVPLGIVLGLGYLLKRLDRRWEAEARAQRQTRVPAEAPVEAPLSGPRPALDIPGRQMPFDPGLSRRPLPGLAAGPARRCWDLKSCSEALRADCPACKDPDMPCWQARTRVEGHMPRMCAECQVYALRLH